MDLPATASVRGRLIVLHEMFLAHFENNANDRAIEILKEIAIDAKEFKSVIPEAPTADPKVRLHYWHQIFERMQKFHKVEKSVDMLRAIRKDSQTCN